MRTLRLISAIMTAALAMVLRAGFADAAIKTQYVDYKDGSTQLKGYLAYDDSKTDMSLAEFAKTLPGVFAEEAERSVEGGTAPHFEAEEIG